jgi:hypothetical protein
MDSNSPVAKPVNSVTVTIVYIAALIWRLTARHSENRRRFQMAASGSFANCSQNFPIAPMISNSPLYIHIEASLWT